MENFQNKAEAFEEEVEEDDDDDDNHNNNGRTLGGILTQISSVREWKPQTRTGGWREQLKKESCSAR